MFVPGTDQCQHIGVPGSSCGVTIQSQNAVGTDVEVIVACASNGQYFQAPGFYQVHFKTETLENMVWHNYELGPVNVSKNI